MTDLPRYDPGIPVAWYDAFAEKEWSRLTHDHTGELLFHVHMDVLQKHIGDQSSVLELGAGAGFYTKELAELAGSLVTSDISPGQLAICRSKMAELGLTERITDFLMLDITTLESIPSASFDTVVCIGGALNYTFDKAADAVNEILRVVRPGGLAIVGVISLLNSLIRYLPAVIAEKGKFGIDATRWLLATGIQDEEHYPVPNRHFLKMMRSSDLDALLADVGVHIVERRAAGVYAMAGEEALGQAREDPEMWKLILDDELTASANPGCLDCGANLIYVIMKQ